LDGDSLRQGLCSDLGFSEAARDENVRRVAEVAKLFFNEGSLVICSLISPMRRHRALARSLITEGRFLEVFVRCSLQTCQNRDPKGMYAKALRGDIAEFTGISAPYEEPLEPELVLDTEQHSVTELVNQIVLRLAATEETAS
jgi:adenylylsulfate kinase